MLAATPVQIAMDWATVLVVCLPHKPAVSCRFSTHNSFVFGKELALSCRFWRNPCIKLPSQNILNRPNAAFIMTLAEYEGHGPPGEKL